MTAPLGSQHTNPVPDSLSPLEEIQAEVDQELDVQAANAELEFLRAQNAKMRATLVAHETKAAHDAKLVEVLQEDAAEAADDERELIAAGCVKVQLDLDNDEQTYVWVKPADQWRSADTSALVAGNFTAWALSCLATPDDVAEWVESNPTVVQVNEFFARWKQATGQDAGKSPGSRRHSRRTRVR